MSKYSSNVLGCLLVVTFFTPLTLPLFTSNSLLLNTLNCLHSIPYLLHPLHLHLVVNQHLSAHRAGATPVQVMQ